MAAAEQRSPFAPTRLQGLRRYYGLLRPCTARRYSRPRGCSRLWLLPSPFPLMPGTATQCKFSRSIRKPGRASRRLHAGCRSVSIRTSTELISQEGSPRDFDIVLQLSTLRQRFTCVRLSRPYLPESCPDVSVTLTTTAFDRSSSRWLGIGDLITEPEGPSFISRTVARNRL